MDGRPLLPLFLALTTVPPPAHGQDPDLPTPEEYAERAARADTAPLFASDDALRMTLRTDIDWLRDERNDSVEVEGTLTFPDRDGSTVVKPVDTRTRGNFRRNKRNCNFPPLRLDVPTGQMKGTVFEGQDKLKLVTPCNDGNDSYQNYVFDEYLAYRILNVLTPSSFRVRLVEITFEDVNGDYDTRTRYGFLIEDDEVMAERNRATLMDVSQFHPARAAGDESVLVGLFNYMIGNTDWSAVYFHNVKLIRTEQGRHVTVPYDFDFSGIVNARYATVDPSLQDRIRRPTQRLYRDFCRPELTYPDAVEPFVGARAAIQALFGAFAARGYDQYDGDDAEDTLEFLEDFWKVVDDPEAFEDEILDDCLGMDPGDR